MNWFRTEIWITFSWLKNTIIMHENLSVLRYVYIKSCYIKTGQIYFVKQMRKKINCDNCMTE